MPFKSTRLKSRVGHILGTQTGERQTRRLAFCLRNRFVYLENERRDDSDMEQGQLARGVK